MTGERNQDTSNVFRGSVLLLVLGTQVKNNGSHV